MAYGSPATAKDVPAYLADIREGRPVSQEAIDELSERYRRIGGRSPLDEITEAQRAGLERELGLPVYVGMKHWRPRIAEAVEAAVAGGAESLVGLVVGPHYSRLSICGYQERLGPDILEELERVAANGARRVLVCPVGFVSDHLEILWDLDIEAREKAAQVGLQLERIESLNDDPEFVRALAGIVEKALSVPSQA